MQFYDDILHLTVTVFFLEKYARFAIRDILSQSLCTIVIETLPTE